MHKPNILFIQVDQLTAAAIKAYGNDIVKAPTIDTLMQEGVVFDNAYCNFPLCAPSRFSMATGQLCSKIGAYDNAAECRAEIPTYAHYLRQQGYQTAISGKMHFIGPDQHHGFEQRLTADLYPADFAWVPNWGNEGKRDTNDERAVKIAGVAERTVQMDFDELVTQEAKQFLYNQARSADSRPFFLQVSYTHPHDPYLCKQKYWDLYEDVDIPLPQVPAMRPEEHDPHSARLLNDFGMLGTKFADEDIVRAIRGYYGSISYLDDLISEVLDTLKACGMQDNTAIVFTSDHGEMLGERGMWFKKHFFEMSMRVPLSITAPWINSAHLPHLVSLVDILPTLNGLAQGSPWQCDVEALDGADLTAAILDNNALSARPVYGEYLAESTLSPIFMMRSGDYKIMVSKDAPTLLFNVVNDPNELHNLSGQKDVKGIEQSMLNAIQQRWDSEQLSQDIRLSQQRRVLIRSAMQQGAANTWNHDEEPDANVLWYRGKEGYNEWAFNYLEAHPIS